MNIGVFDSGLGGLTVLKELVKALPKYNYVYLGDTARNPYGTRSKDTIVSYCKEAVDFFFEEQECELVIFACNTASAEALCTIQKEYLEKFGSKTKRVLGVLIPTAELAASTTLSGRIGVMATSGTVKSGAYIRELKKLNPEISVHQVEAPLLVPLIESGWGGKPETHSILKKYLRPLKDANIDTLILGCTHYPVVIRAIRRIMGKKVKLVASAEATANALINYLERHPTLEAMLSKEAKVTYFTTDDPERFLELGKRIFHGSMGKVSKVELGHCQVV